MPNNDAEITVGYPSSLLWSELKTCAAILEDQDARILAIGKEMHGNTADGAWLDYWMMDHFGQRRLEGETDLQYYTRAKHEILSKRVNNMALVQLVKDALGIDVTIADAYPVEPGTATIGRFYLDMTVPSGLTTEETDALVAKVKGVVTRSRGAGTYFTDRAFAKNPSLPVETITASEVYSIKIIASVSDALVPGYIKCGAGWKVETPGLKVGNNDAIKEQINVKTIQVSDGTTSSQALYGG